MKVFILAGGLGMRIRPLFPDVQKCLIPIHGKPFLEWQIKHLIAQGFRDFVICAGYRAEQVMEYFKDGAALDISINYSVRTAEEVQNDTGYAIRIAAPFFHEASLVLNGDTYLPIDYRAFVQAHMRSTEDQHTVASIALVSMPAHEGSGRVMLDGRGRVSAFMEKRSDQGTGFVSAGAYIFEPGIMRYIPEGPSSLERDVFPTLAAERLLQGVPVESGFIDIGTPKGYAALEALLV